MPSLLSPIQKNAVPQINPGQEDHAADSKNAPMFGPRQPQIKFDLSSLLELPKVQDVVLFSQSPFQKEKALPSLKLRKPRLKSLAASVQLPPATTKARENRRYENNFTSLHQPSKMDMIMAKRLETSTMSPFDKSIETSLMQSTTEARDDPLSGCVTSLGEASIGIPTFVEASTRNNPSPLGGFRGVIGSFSRALDTSISTTKPSNRSPVEESGRWSQAVKNPIPVLTIPSRLKTETEQHSPTEQGCRKQMQMNRAKQAFKNHFRFPEAPQGESEQADVSIISPQISLEARRLARKRRRQLEEEKRKAEEIKEPSEAEKRKERMRAFQNHIRRLIHQLDKLVERTTFQTNVRTDNLKEVLSKFKIDKRQWKEGAMKKIKNQLAEQSDKDLSICMINRYKKKKRKIEYEQRNGVIIEMLEQNKNDYNLVQELHSTQPETREMVNLLIKALSNEMGPLSDDALQRHLTTTFSISSIGSGDRTDLTNQTSRLVDGMKLLLKYQQKMIEHDESKDSSLDIMEMFKWTEGESAPQSLKTTPATTPKQASRKQKSTKKAAPRINYHSGPILKFRTIVAKHFLSKPLEEVEQMNLNRVNMGLVVKISNLRTTLDDMLPTNMGLKYTSLDKNLYENEFLQELLAAVPAFKSKLRLKQQKKELGENATLEVPNLNKLFVDLTDKSKFYINAKKRNPSRKDEQDGHGQAMRAYFKQCADHMLVGQPDFLTFDQNIMYLSQERISLVQGKALRQYLTQTRQMPDKRVYSLVIDSCGMLDEVFSEILEGIIAQQETDPLSGEITTQFLSSLIYTNNQFGPKSLDRLAILLPNLLELTLNNVGSTVGPRSKAIFRDVTLLVEERGKKLMKIKLSNNDLSADATVTQQLCYTIETTRALQLLDLQWAKLTPKNLETLSESLLYRLKSLRMINLSYNKLVFEEGHPDFAPSTAFLGHLREFLETSLVINHVKLSGMNFGKTQLIDLGQALYSSPLMLSIHLNDNEITRDNELMYELLDIFGLGEEELVQVNRAFPTRKNQKARFQNKVHIEYLHHMRQYLRFFKPNPSESVKAVNQARIMMKDHLMLSKQQRIVENYKAINSCQLNQGAGRIDDNEIDHFVLTRNVNYPELVFNQRLQPSNTKQGKYFVRDFAQKWQLSKRNECFVCEKHHYTIVFYERGIVGQNWGLTEIHDQEFLSKLKEDFDANFLQYKSMGPYVCGTVVHRDNGTGVFDKKLKMIRASLFTLLSISQSQLFTKDRVQTKHIKDGLLKYLEYDSKSMLKQIKVSHKLEGWQKILEDKCQNNELTQVHVVNEPNFQDSTINQREIFVYANFLPPGYHQILIYDPMLERAFCHDMVLNLNQKDFYPEYPLLHGVKSNKNIQNVWRHWLEDTEEEIDKSFISDTETEEFAEARFIKNEEDWFKCLQVLKENFDIIKIYQHEMLFGSSKYPQVDWDRIWHFVEHIQQNKTLLSEKQKFARAQVELCFIRATRNDETKGLKSAVQRCELYELILRMAQSWIYQNYGTKEKISDRLNEYIRIFILPIKESSKILEHRRIIRASKRLNQLLFENLRTLEMIFNEYKQGSKGFTLESANKFFLQFNYLVTYGGLNTKKIEESFIFSMMTVLNENRSMKKYEYLKFIEFLEMLCRISLQCVPIVDTIEVKVFNFLELIYYRRYDDGIWNEQDYPLVPINYDYD